MKCDDGLCTNSRPVSCEMCSSRFPFSKMRQHLLVLLDCSPDQSHRYTVGVIFLGGNKQQHHHHHKVPTEQRDLLRDAVDIYNGPERTADAEPAVEEDRLSIVDAVENSSMAVGPEGQHVVPQGHSLGQSFGPVAGPRHQVRAGVLGDVCRGQFAGVQTGETKAQCSTPAGVHAAQAKTHLTERILKTLVFSPPALKIASDTEFRTNLLIEVDGPVAESDAVAEAVLARGAAKLPVQPDVLAFGVGVKSR